MGMGCPELSVTEGTAAAAAAISDRGCLAKLDHHLPIDQRWIPSTSSRTVKVRVCSTREEASPSVC
jgi:hypothetical protein